MSKIYECPFIIRERDNRGLVVHCEGCTIRFPDPQSRTEFIGAFCANQPGWQKCPLAITLERYYERNERNDKHEKH